MPDLPSLLERIAILLDEQPGTSPRRLLEAMEHTLTDGYAYALGLEAESIRIEREVAAALAAAESGKRADGLGDLNARRESTSRDLHLLRERLRRLNHRADLVRRASLAA